MSSFFRTFWSRYHRWVLALVVVVGAIVLISQYKTSQENKARETVTVELRSVVEEVVIAGRIQTGERADLGFNRAGRIASIDVAEGDTVRRGETLARLSMGQLYADLQSAQAQYDIARADADTTDEDVTTAEISLANTRAEQELLVQNAYRALLNNDLQAYNDDAGDAAAAPTITGAYQGIAEGEYVLGVYSSSSKSGYSYSLSGLGVGTESVFTGMASALGSEGLYIQFDEDSNYANQTWRVPIPNTRSTTYVTALNAYTAAQASADRAIDAAERSLERLRAQENTTNRDARTQAAIDQAQARVNGVYAQISDGTIRAPFDGVVGSVLVEPGEHASVGQNIFSFLGAGEYELVLNVPEIDVNRVALGDQVVVELDAYPGVVWDGQIVSLDRAETFVDGVPVYETVVQIVDADERIRSGMNGQARVVVAQRDRVIAVPSGAISRVDRDTYRVQVVRGETLQDRDVTLGIRGSDSFVEVLDGLEVGDQVVLDSR